MNERRKKVLIYVLCILVLGFIILTALILAFPNSVVDREFSEEIQEHQNPALDYFMKFVSWFGYMPYSLISVLFTAAVFYLFNYKKPALFILFTLVSGLVSSSMKILVNRPRPTDSVVRIVEKANNQSFPSGHVVFYVVFFGFLALLMYHLMSIPKKLRLVAGVFALLMVFAVPLSRVYLGAHWFTDVIGGFILGLLTLFILSYLYLRKPN